jgi:hypothetical protein
MERTATPEKTHRAKCPGTGQPAEARQGDVFPYCSVCGQQMAAQGRKASLRYRNAWTSVPLHYTEAR